MFVVNDVADVYLPQGWVSWTCNVDMFIVEGVSIGVQVSDHTMS